MHALLVTIELKRPLLATALVGDPNSTESYDFIPGGSLRGILASRYLERGGDAAGAEFRRLFLDGAVRFLHGYALHDEVRALPTPFQLRSKGQFDEDSFCVPSANGPVCFRPERDVAVHVQRDPRLGRAVRRREGRREVAMGTVFRYEAIAAGQRFQAAVLADDAADLVTIAQLLDPFEAWIGRSRSAAYGLVALSHSVADPWPEAPASQPASTFTLHFLSDTILRDALGRYVTTADEDALSAALEIAVKKVEHEGNSLRSTLVGGFNRAWRTPLPQAPAIAAGSVLVLATRDGQPPDPGRIATILAEGIGERRAEGYGRVAFNWDPRQKPVRAADDAAPETTTAVEGEPVRLKGPGAAVARQMAERLFDEAVEKQIIDFVQTHVWRELKEGAPLPSNSQLARLAVLVRQAGPSGDTASVLEAFERFRVTAARAYERARLRRVSLDHWVRTLLDHPERVWLQLYSTQNDPAEGETPEAIWKRLVAPKAPVVAGVSVAYDAARDRRVALLLLAAVLAAPAQKRKNQEFIHD